MHSAWVLAVKRPQTNRQRDDLRSDGWITAGLLWTPGSAIYYCNGREVLRWEDPRISSVPADLMFTLPCGGWDNNALDDAKLPGDFVIDYVRCWQRKDLAGK
jgi:beta-glucanase (GH16 family)